MKVKISTVVDIPDDQLEPSARYQSAIQFIFDVIVNYVTFRHQMDALDAMNRAESLGFEPVVKNKIVKHHEFMGDMCKNLKWTYEEVKE